MGRRCNRCIAFVFMRGGQTDARRLHERVRQVEEKLLLTLQALIKEHGPQVNLRGEDLSRYRPAF